MFDPQVLAMLPVWYAVFLLSITCHEAAHALVALRGGDSTAYLGGQVSLNPIPHVRREPMGTVIVPLLTFASMGWMMGWASAPYDPHWEARHPKRAAWMAAAGPLANLVLAAIAFAILKGGLHSGAWVVAPESLALDRLVGPGPGAPRLLDGVGRLLSVQLVLNLVLAVFNLLPVPPMDGASVLSGLSAPVRSFYERLRGTPIAALAGLVLAYSLSGVLFPPIIDWVLVRLYG